MAFQHYKSIAQVQKAYNIRYQESDFIMVSPAIIPEHFLSEFEFNIKNLDVFSSEGSRCEFIILPVLREAYKNHVEQFVLWVQKPIRYDKSLNGIPDYMVSKRSKLGKTILEHPLVMITEAKKNDFEQGWGQCLAELVAAQKLNDNDDLTIYGIVTDAKTWEFGKLQRDVFTKNMDNFSISQMEMLMGALNFLFVQISQNIASQ